MKELDNKKVERITRNILDECDIYPKPDEDEVRKEVRKMNAVFENELDGVSEKRVVNKLSKSFELKRRLDDDEWIIYEGELFDVRR